MNPTEKEIVDLFQTNRDKAYNIFDLIDKLKRPHAQILDAIRSLKFDGIIVARIVEDDSFDPDTRKELIERVFYQLMGYGGKEIVVDVDIRSASMSHDNSRFVMRLSEAFAGSLEPLKTLKARTSKRFRLTLKEL